MTQPTTIAAAEAALLARLSAVITGYAVEPFPGKPADYRLTHQRGAFLVAYRGSTYADSEDTEAVAQIRLQQFDINVLARQLRGGDGAYVMLDKARVALAGHRIPGFTKCRPQREVFLGEKEGVFIYALTVALGTLAVEVDDEDLAPVLVHISELSSFATSEVTSA